MAEELRINITVDNAQAAQQLDKTAQNAERAGVSLKGMSSAISEGVNPSIGGMIAMLESAAPVLIALTVIVAAITAYGKALDFVITEANAAEKVEAQQAAVLRSTAGAAGMTTEALDDLASQLSETTGIEDDVIKASENLTLTFTNIGKSIFPQATATALDLAQAFGMDLNNATIMLDKALQDPIQGMTALRRVGISFTEAEQEMIKSMVEHNRVAAAQGEILRIVSTQVSGSAAAIGTTLGGEFGKFQNLLKNLGENFGKILTPLLSAGLGSIVTVLQEVVKGAQPAFKALQDGAKALGDAFKTPEMRKELKELGTEIGKSIGELGPVAIRNVVDAMTQFAQLVVQYGPQIVRSFTQIAQAASVISSAIAGVITSLQQMGATAGQTLAAMGALPGFAGGVSNFSGGLAIVGENGPEPVFLPRGSTVLSNREAKEALSGSGGTNMTFNNVTFTVQGGDMLTLENLAMQIQQQTAMAGANS